MDGLADMVSDRAGGTLDYNLFVEAAGTYALSLRVAGERGTISVFDDGVLVGSVLAQAGGWRTLSLAVPLDAGTETLRLRFGSAGQVVNWIDLRAVAVPEPASLGVLGLAAVALRRRRVVP